MRMASLTYPPDIDKRHGFIDEGLGDGLPATPTRRAH